MDTFHILLLVSSLFIFHGEASFATMMVKEGEEVPVSFVNASAIKRNVSAGEQVFHFDGIHKGKFVDSQGKEVESSNYAMKDGDLIIKNFTKSDVGMYAKEPNTLVERSSDGSSYEVVGPTLMIEIKH